VFSWLRIEVAVGDFDEVFEGGDVVEAELGGDFGEHEACRGCDVGEAGVSLAWGSAWWAFRRLARREWGV